MEEYDEDEIGALDHEELEGTMNPDSERLHALAEEFIERQQNQKWDASLTGTLLKGSSRIGWKRPFQQ